MYCIVARYASPIVQTTAVSALNYNRSADYATLPDLPDKIVMRSPVRTLLRRGGAAVRSHEVDLFGVNLARFEASLASSKSVILANCEQFRRQWASKGNNVYHRQQLGGANFPDG